LKIATIIGARPQFIKTALISEKIKTNRSLSEIIIHTGQHFDYKMSDIFFKEMKIPKPNYNLNINQFDYGKMIEKMVKKITPILISENIKGVLVYGDTNSTLAGSISAKQLNLPIFHVEAGLRSFNRLMLEENNRIITDHLSSLLFCPSKNAVSNLMKENLKNGVTLSGDVMFDVYLKFSSQRHNFRHDLKRSEFVLATIHRRENIDFHDKLSAIFNSLNKINDDKKIIMPLHPHTKQKIKKFKIKSKIKFIEPQGYASMLSLLNDCEMVITDSGGLQKESFFAKKKCIIVRKETEWVELVNQGTSIVCSPKNLYNIYNEISKIKCDFSISLYGDGNASSLILNSIENFFSR
tara:strand:+ start:1227 stop:2282 length:1056 start_codon:yes stop_codon:yes gene_type:complete